MLPPAANISFMWRQSMQRKWIDSETLCFANIRRLVDRKATNSASLISPEARAFYEKLGFEEAFAMGSGGTPTEAFLKVNDRQFIELYPQREPSQRIGFMHVCFESADVEKLNGEYLSRGLGPTPVKKAGAGNLLFTMEGPERQNIEYTQYMPGSKHTNDIGLHLGANRISQQIVGLGIEMRDPAAASSFNEQKLGFRPAQRAFEGGFRRAGDSR